MPMKNYLYVFISIYIYKYITTLYDYKNNMLWTFMNCMSTFTTLWYDYSMALKRAEYWSWQTWWKTSTERLRRKWHAVSSRPNSTQLVGPEWPALIHSPGCVWLWVTITWRNTTNRNKLTVHRWRIIDGHRFVDFNYCRWSDQAHVGLVLRQDREAKTKPLGTIATKTGSYLRIQTLLQSSCQSAFVVG